MVSDEIRYAEAFRNDVAAVTDRIRTATGDTGAVDVVVHPGFYDYYPHDFDVEEPYGAFRAGLEQELAVSDADRQIVLYPENHRSETERYLPAPERAGFIPTFERSALLDEDGRDAVASIIDDLADDAEVHLYGELNGCCYTHVRQLFEEVEEQIQKEYAVIEERYFPEDELLTI